MRRLFCSSRKLVLEIWRRRRRRRSKEVFRSQNVRTRVKLHLYGLHADQLFDSVDQCGGRVDSAKRATIDDFDVGIIKEISLESRR